MKRVVTLPDLSAIPEVYHPLLTQGPVYDSSCSTDARVYYIPREGGLFLKSAAAGALKQEAELNAWFHEKSLGPEVLSYRREDQDWLLTRQISGEDCTWPGYMADPRRLTDTLARLLRQLHDTVPSGCPAPDRTLDRLSRAEKAYQAGIFESWGFSSPEDAWALVEANRSQLNTQVLIHGDYCLPNIMLDNWRFSGFIDLGAAGPGDRHIDVFWALWTLKYNLKTDAYHDRFLDAYGRDLIHPELLRTVCAMECFL